MKPEAALETSARAQVRKRDPGMLRVPHNGRNRAKSENHEQQVQPGTLELLSEPGCQGEHEESRNQLKGVGIFGKKTKAN